MIVKSSSGTDSLDIDSVIYVREYLIKARSAEKWVGNVVDRRISFLDSLIVAEFLKNYKPSRLKEHVRCEEEVS